MARARVSTHKGNVTALFLPHHCELFAATPAEISSAVVQKLVGETSMSSSKVLNKEGDKTATKAAPTQQSVRSWSPQQNAPAQPTAPRPKGQIIGGLEFLDLDGIKAAISDVRSDKKENDCMLLLFLVMLTWCKGYFWLMLMMLVHNWDLLVLVLAVLMPLPNIWTIVESFMVWCEQLMKLITTPLSNLPWFNTWVPMSRLWPRPKIPLSRDRFVFDMSLILFSRLHPFSIPPMWNCLLAAFPK